MSIIVNGKEYPDERSVPEQYRMQTQMGTRQRDPGNFSPDLAPNVGRSVLPHVTTFSGMMSTLARTYRQHDEAIRHNKHNANMMRRDPMIMGPLFARQMAVALLQWQVQPEDSSDEKQVQVAKELTFMVSRIPRFREYLRNLMEAVWYGRYGIQNVWGFTRDSRGVRYRTVVDWVPVNGDKLLFRYDDGTGRYDHDEIGVKVSVAHVKDDIWAGKPDIEWNSEGTGVFLRRWERSRLVVHKNFMMDGDYEDPTTAGMIHGVGLRHFLYWSWYQKQETLAQLAEVVERAGMGFTVYTYPAGNAQAREEVERLAEEQAHKNQIVLPMEVSNPDAYSIQQIPPNTQGIMALQSLIDDYFGSWIIKFILGQTLSYRAEAGTPGISDLHRDSFLQIVKYDSLGVEETVTKDLIRMLLMFNFPSYQNVNFQFKLNTEEAVPLEKLQALQAAWSMGAKIKSEDVMGLIGLNVAGATDQALYNPQVLASLKEYEMMEEQQEKEEEGGQGTQITESQDEALAAMLGPVMQSKRYSKYSNEDNFDVFDDADFEGSADVPMPSTVMPTGEQTEDRKELRDEFDPKLDQVKSDATLHPEKEEFFSESKVRDNDGKLLVLYHGTPNGKLVQHDRRLSGDPDLASHGQGYYHTDNLDAAKDYALNSDGTGEANPAVHAVHLNIKNPFDVSKDEIDSKDFISWYKGTTGDAESAKKMMQKIDEMSSNAGKIPSDYESLKALGGGTQKYLSRYLRSKGFDGLKAQGSHGRPGQRSIDHTIYMAFHPSQIKSVSNVTPSGDPRMDYVKDEYAKKSESGNYKPTKGMIGNAKRGLELRKKHEKGGTAVGVARARDIINGKDLSFSTVKRMHSFFSRHAGNEEGGEDDAGYIAWLLWGGDSGRNWARSIVESERKNQAGDVDNEGDPSVIDTPEEDLTEPAPQRRGEDSLFGAIASGAMEGATRGAARRLTGQQGFQFAKDEDDDGLRQGGLFDDVPVKDDYIPKKKEPKAPSNERQGRLFSEDDLHNLQHDLEQRKMFEKKNDPDRYMMDEDDRKELEEYLSKQEEGDAKFSDSEIEMREDLERDLKRYASVMLEKYGDDDEDYAAATFFLKNLDRFKDSEELLSYIEEFGTGFDYDEIKDKWDRGIYQISDLGDSPSELIEKALVHFGETENPKQAGYILPDGTMLNFGSDGVRHEDHRSIGVAYKEHPHPGDKGNDPTAYMSHFMDQTGAIRWMPSAPGLSLHSAPTKAQMDTINRSLELMGSEGEEFYWDRDEHDPKGEKGYPYKTTMTGDSLYSLHDAINSDFDEELMQENEDYSKEPERNAMGAGPRDHSPEDFDVTGKQINGQATANRGTMPKQATQSSMPSKADKGSVSTNPVSKTGMSSDATRMDRGASLANMRDKFMKYRKTKLIEMLQPFVQEDPDFSLTDAQGKKRRTSLFKADKYSLANTLASKYAEGEDPYARTKPLDRHIDGVIESYVGEGMGAEDKKDLSDSLYNTWRDVHSEHQADVSDFNKNLNSLAQQFGYERAEGAFTRKARSAEDVDAIKRLDESQQDLVRNTISSAGKLGLKVSGGDDIEKVHSALMHGHQKPLGKTHDDIWKEVIQRERLDEFSKEQNEEEEVPPITGEEAESLLEGQRAATEQQLEEFIEGQGAEKPTPSANEPDEPYGLEPTADPEVPTIRVEGELPVTVEESPLTKITESALGAENIRSFMRGIGKDLGGISVEHKRQWLEANDIEPKNIQSEKTLNSMIRKFIREKAESKPEEEPTQQELSLQPTPEPVKPIQPTQAQLDMVQDLIKSEETPDKLQGFINELKGAAESGDAKSLNDILEERDEFAFDKTLVTDPERLESLNVWIDSIEQTAKTGDMDAVKSLASGEEPVSMRALDEEKEKQIAQGQQEREKRAAQEKQEATFQQNRQRYWDQVGEEEGMKRILDFIVSDQAPDKLEGFVNKLKEAADSGTTSDLISVLDEWEQTEEDIVDPGVKQEDIPLERKNDLNDWIGSIEGLVRSGDIEAAKSFARGEKPVELPRLIKGISKETGLVEGELTDAEKLEQLKQDQEERIIQRRAKARAAFEEQETKERNQTLKELKEMALDQKAKAEMFESKTPVTADGGRVSESTIDEYHASALPHLDSSTVVKIGVAGEDRGAIRFSSDGAGSFVMEHEKPNGDKIYYDAKQAKKALGKSFNKIAGQAILRDNKAWAGKALMAGLVTPDAASKLTKPASQTYMTTQMKAKINEAAITAMANLGTSNGGINLGDYSNTRDAADAAFDKMRGHMNDIQKPGGWLDTLKGAGFAYNDKASVADNYVNGMQYVMEKAGQTGFRASKQKNAVENMQGAIQHLSEQSEDEKGWSPWAVAGGIGILAVLLLFYSVMKD